MENSGRPSFQTLYVCQYVTFRQRHGEVIMH
nr:MAG TPA: hypothetical protein [Bacteriophage sp.]